MVGWETKEGRGKAASPVIISFKGFSLSANQCPKGPFVLENQVTMQICQCSPPSTYMVFTRE